MTEEGYYCVKANPTTCPLLICLSWVANFIKNSESFSLGEVRGVKANKSGRESVG